MPKREVSATREAVRVLREYLKPTAASEGTLPPDSGRPCTSGTALDSDVSAPQPADGIAVIKLACKGVVCLRLLGEGSPSKVVEKLLLDVEQRRRPLLQCASPESPLCAKDPSKHPVGSEDPCDQFRISFMYA